jgi:hypothetical protein
VTYGVRARGVAWTKAFSLPQAGFPRAPPYRCGCVIATFLPVAAVGGSAVNWANLAHAAKGPAYPPGPGDVLGLLRRDGELGANGALPQNDEIGKDLLRAAGDPNRLAEQAGPLANLPRGPLGIPGVVLDAYLHAQRRMAGMDPGCHLDWPLLAGIGKVESNQARNGQVDARGTTVEPILGPRLDGGPDTAAVADTDGGRFDGDRAWDRAVGPMQFIPSTWVRYASDGNGDGTADPDNVYDAALAAARYLCAGGGDLSQPADRARAVFSYNHSDNYVRIVLLWADAYAVGITPLPSQPVLPVSYPLPVPGAPAPAPQPAPPPGPNPPAAPAPPPPGQPPGSAGPPGMSPGQPTGTPPPSGGTTSPPASSTTTTPTCPSPTTTTTTTTSPSPTATTTTPAAASCAPPDSSPTTPRTSGTTMPTSRRPT